jgi:putative DNA methylase
MTQVIKAPKKLIEVALPLDAINVAAAREKSIRHGHPSTLHLWWARRPLAAARAVIFGQMVNDPSWKWELEHPGEIPPNNLKASWAVSRNRLFAIIEDLVKWTNTTNEKVLEKARAEIRKSWRETCELNKDHPQASELFNPDKLPAFHDPFAGGGALPLEAQRLGLESYASDLNPVAVLINKAMIEIPPKFAGRPPVNPEARGKRDLSARTWKGAEGLAEDVRYYGQWMRDEAQKRIGNLYPLVEITKDMAKDRPDLKPLIGQKLTVIAWIWARTVKSPNPAFRHVDVPLASTFVLSSGAGKEAYIQPVIEEQDYHFDVKTGKPTKESENGTKLSRGANFRCIMSNSPISPDYIKSEAQAGRLGQRLLAMVCQSGRKRIFLAPAKDFGKLSKGINASWSPDIEISGSTQYIGVRLYGMTRFSEMFTERQLVMLTTFCDLVSQARKQVEQDYISHHGEDWKSDGAREYADAVGTYLGACISKLTAYHCTLSVWRADLCKSGRAFGRQAIQMVWDFAECNPFAGAGGDWEGVYEDCAGVVRELPSSPLSHAGQLLAQNLQGTIPSHRIFSSDPPYYDNVPYSDLSDFYYVWLRKAIQRQWPDLFATVAAPKADELVAFAYRHSDKQAAETFFLNGMTRAISGVAFNAHPAFPITLYYAFRQSDVDSENGVASTGWETFLDAVIHAGFAISGTWPMRTELSGALKTKRNALASSIILVCCKRDADAPTASRREFIRELNQVLPAALDEMTRGSGDGHSPVAPVDLSQAIIGPGMAVFSKYAAVLEADGTPMSVRTALQLINRFLAEDDFDHDTQFCLHWFEQYGWKDGKFGEADVLARAKATSVDGVKHAGVVYASGGIVRLLKWSDYPADWDAETDDRLPVWELLHQLIRVFKTDGETGAGKVLAAAQGKAEATRQLSYRLHTLCERAGWAEDARAYHEIVTSWSAIEAAATAAPVEKQASLFS